MKSLYLSLCFILISCGKSPILEHDHEVKTKRFNSTSVQSQSVENDFGFKTLNISIIRLWLHGPYPIADQESSVLLILKDSEGNLTDLPNQYDIVAEGWMDSMGHGTADDGYIERTGLGNYLHKELYFNMAGDWSYSLYLYKGEELVDQTTYNFEF